MSCSILRLLAGFGMLIFFKNSGLFGIFKWSLSLFIHFSVIDGSGWVWVRSHCKECLVHVGFPQDSILRPTLLTRHDFCFCYLCLVTDRVSFGTWIWHNMRDWGWCDRERLVDFVAGKTQLVSCYHWNNLTLLMLKWMCLFLMENYYWFSTSKTKANIHYKIDSTRVAWRFAERHRISGF